MDRNELTVGQRVWIYSINSRGQEPGRAEVVKIGSKLVQLAAVHRLGNGEEYVSEYPQAYRIDDQRKNDKYGHESFRTDVQRAEAERKAVEEKFFQSRGIIFDRRKCDVTAEHRSQLVTCLREMGYAHPDDEVK